jgi:hypothetical protein
MPPGDIKEQACEQDASGPDQGFTDYTINYLCAQIKQVQNDSSPKQPRHKMPAVHSEYLPVD